MKQRKTSVLIVGAGPVGLSAALALARAGVPVRIIEARVSVDRRTRASTFHPPTLDIADDLGLGDALIGLGLKVPRWQMRQHDTGETVTFDLGAIGDATSHPFRLQVEQYRFSKLAADALASLGTAVEFGTSAFGLEQDEHSVTVELTSGEAITADWVIGADGATSAVRKAVGLEYGGITHTHSSVLVTTAFPFHEHIDGLADVSYCWSRRGPFSLLRLRELWRVSLRPGVEDLDAAGDEARVREWLAYIHPAAREAALQGIYPYRVHERCVDRFRIGRVFLAGDSAHLNPASVGMGMNGGIHDAMSLTAKLLAVIGGADAGILDRYERQRRHVVTKHIIPQASASRERMATTDVDLQRERLAEQRAIAADPARCREVLLQSSMITGLRAAEAIE